MDVPHELKQNEGENPHTQIPPDCTIESRASEDHRGPPERRRETGVKGEVREGGKRRREYHPFVSTGIPAKTAERVRQQDLEFRG